MAVFGSPFLMVKLKANITSKIIINWIISYFPCTHAQIR